MAFGKDSSNLGGIPTYGGNARQQAAAASRQKKHSVSGGSRRPYWSGAFKPSTSVVSRVRLLKGEYEHLRDNGNGGLYKEILPWQEYREHYQATSHRGALCSGGVFFMDRNRREPCLGCEEFWDGRAKNKRTMSMSNKFAFNVVIEQLFHKMPQLDAKTNQYRMNPKTNAPYTEWERCRGLGCIGCQTQAETRQGSVQPWVLSKEHFNQLDAYSEYIGNGCTTCGGRSTVSTVMWVCGNPACGELIFDMQNPALAAEQIKEITLGIYDCQTCHTSAYPEEVIQCAVCTPSGGVPVRATIYDVDMDVKLQLTGDGDKTSLIVLAYSDPKRLDTQYADLLQYQVPLEKRFAPTPLTEQASIWNKQMPMQQGQQGQQRQMAPQGQPMTRPYQRGIEGQE